MCEEETVAVSWLEVKAEEAMGSAGGKKARVSWNIKVTFHLLSVAQLSTHFFLFLKFSGAFLFLCINYEV